MSGSCAWRVPIRLPTSVPICVLTGGLLLALTGCKSAFRYPVEPQDTALSADAALLEGMNPFVLTNALTDRLVLEIDWVEGQRPHADALEGLERTLARYLPPGKTIEIDVDDAIPLASWDALEGSFLDRQAVLAPFLDHDPAAAEFDLVWLIVVPGEERFLGWTTEWVLAPQGGGDGAPRRVDVVFLFRDSIEREAALWITPRKVEQAILIHELGHVLGLVSGPDHIEQDNPRHCTEPGCVMAHHRARSQLYNAPAALIGKIPDDFCGKCRRDIARAQALWAARAAAETDFANALRRRRDARELRATACWYAQAGDWIEAADRLRRARSLEGKTTADSEGSTLPLERLCDAPKPD